LDSESPHVSAGGCADIHPEIIQCSDWHVRDSTPLKVSAFDGYHTRNTSAAREHSNPLAFVKLNPQGMQALAAGFS